MIDELKHFIKKVNNFDDLKASEQIDYFAYFLSQHNKQEDFTASQIKNIFSVLRILPYSNISRYLNENSNKAKAKKDKAKYIKTKNGYHILSSFELELQANIKEDEKSFMTYSVNSEKMEWKPSDIPFLNTKIKKNADFFSKLYYLLYHLENSLRKFLTIRLQSILGSEWDKKLTSEVDLTKAQQIRTDTNLSEMLQERGDSILYYCMWDDYGKIIKKFPNIFSIQKDCDEILAHLNSLAKVRNAIAHNTATIPSEYQDELTLFIKKYIKIMKNNI